MAVTWEQLQQGNLDRVEIYLERFGGCVVLHELTGSQLLKAARYTRGYVDVDPGSVDSYERAYVAMRVLLAMVEPAPPGETEEQRATHLETILGLPAVDQILLCRAYDLLCDGELSAEQRAVLKQQRPPGELLEALSGGASPEMVVALTPEEEQEDLYRVALRVPQVLFGEVPAGVIRRLAETLRREQVELAELTAAGYFRRDVQR